METFEIASTAQDLFVILEAIPESVRSRMVISVAIDPDIDHDETDVEAISIVEDGGEVNMLRLSKRTD